MVNQSRYLGIQWQRYKSWCRYPILRRLAPQWSGYASVKAAFDSTMEFWAKLAREHDDDKMDVNNNEEEDGRDFIDFYLEANSRAKEEARQGQSYCYSIFQFLLGLR